MISATEMKELIKFSDKDERFGVAFRGALSQIRVKIYLESLGFNVEENQSDNVGNPDFIIAGKTLEHKRAKKDISNDGSLVVEVQKSRGKVPSRLYDDNFSDFISVDISHHTGKKNDFRFIRTKDLKKHNIYDNKIHPLQKIDENWVTKFELLL